MNTSSITKVRQIIVTDNEAAGIRDISLYAEGAEIGRIDIVLPESGQAHGRCYAVVDGAEYELSAYLLAEHGKPAGPISIYAFPPTSPPENMQAAPWNQYTPSQEWQPAGDGWLRIVEARPKLVIDYTLPADD